MKKNKIKVEKKVQTPATKETPITPVVEQAAPTEKVEEKTDGAPAPEVIPPVEIKPEEKVESPAEPTPDIAPPAKVKPEVKEESPAAAPVKEPAQKEAPVAPKVEPPKQKAKSVKKETPLDVPTIEEVKPNGPTPVSIAQGLTSLQSGRLSPDKQVELASLIYKEYVTNPEAPELLRSAMKQQFDAMSCVNILIYNTQLKNDFESLGIQVKTQLFDTIAANMFELFGIVMPKGLPSKEDASQTVINFAEVEVPTEVKTAIVQDTEATKKKTEVPEDGKLLTEAERKECIRAILGRQGTKTDNMTSMGVNLVDAAAWTKRTYDLDTDIQGIAKLVSIFTTFDKDNSLVDENLLLQGFTNIAYGSAMRNNEPFSALGNMHKHLPIFAEKDLAEITKIFISRRAEINSLKTKTTFAENGVIKLLTQLSENLDTVVDDIIKETEKEVPEIIKTVCPGVVDTEINPTKTFNMFASSFDCGPKECGDYKKNVAARMKEMGKLFATPINRLESYCEKIETV